MKNPGRLFLALTFPTVFVLLNSCVALYNTRKYVDSDFKNSTNSEISNQHIIIETTENNTIKFYCHGTKHVDYYTQEVRNYQSRKAKWVTNVDYGAWTVLLGIPALAIDIINPIPMLGFETSDYSYSGSKKKTDSKEFKTPLSNNRIALRADNDIIQLDDDRLYTDDEGYAQTFYTIGKSLITTDHPYWEHSLFTKVSPTYANITVSSSAGDKKIKLGPFKDINLVIERAVDNYSRKILSTYFSELTLNILDKNTHRPVKYADVKIKLEKEELTQKKIKDLITKEVSTKFPLKTNWIKNAIIEETFSRVDREVNYDPTHTTNSSGKIHLVLLKKSYSVEFIHDYYNWSQHSFNLNSQALDYNVYLTDVGSKIRVEKVKTASNADLIERNN